MRIAVTGAQGLIGQAVIKLLSSEGVTLTCLSRRDLPISPENITWLSGDLNERDVAEKIISDHDVIIHLAHESIPLTASGDLINDAQRSLYPSLQLIQAAARLGNKPYIIYLSSGGAVYGSGSGTSRPFYEADICAPIMIYGIQKHTIERYLHNAAENGILSTTILRVSNAYGALLPSERMQGLIGTSVSRIIEGKTLRLIGNPNNVRDYVHITDIAKAIQKSLVLGSNYEIINIGSGVGHSVQKMLELIIQISGYKTSVISEEVSGSNLLPDWCVLDVSKARRVLNWEPQVTLEQGITAMFSMAAHKNIVWKAKVGG